MLSELKEHIALVKRNVKSENSDYLAGYVCALSAVEGMIAEMEEKMTKQEIVIDFGEGGCDG